MSVGSDYKKIKWNKKILICTFKDINLGLYTNNIIVILMGYNFILMLLLRDLILRDFMDEAEIALKLLIKLLH